ncbi:conserved hypothetical protein [Methylocella tundrae]|uniref:Glycosyltransferase 2-like domain-containing protein n=1 Tax=Methylocella tundrae TaxID=227605 RepID=A0A8B6MCD2_METTU|nr:hypothetical protein [Methylocella tundrae]VTZ26141.1 conserved hypothetical protein [Methylocella tundrae]VTZ51656.1 conserved hypothetical protein [Methylocella tundrae]
MKVLLISTVDAAGSRLTLFDRMVKSIAESAKTLPDDALTLCILFQNCSEDRLTTLRTNLPAFVECSCVDRFVPLSVARNMLLSPKRAAGVMDAGAVVAFPDDDAWYPDKFLAGVVGLFRDHANLDFWFCRYGAKPRSGDWSAPALTSASRSAVVRKSSSNTIFVRGSVAAAVGEFDEKLGVGTALASAEDVDYALRIFDVARLSVLRDEALVGHRDKPPGLRGKYYPGSLFVVARHARRAGLSEFLRKIAIGLYLVVKGELSLGRYVSALRTALSAFDQPIGGHKLAQE